MTQGGAADVDGRDPWPAVESLRAAGAARLAPVRFRRLEAFAKRLRAHRGAARRQLDVRFARLAAELGCELEAIAAAERATVSPSPSPSPSPAEATGLGVLLDRLAIAALPALAPRHASDQSVDARAPVEELRTLREFAATWERLRVEQRLSQSRARVPQQAGPLNSQRLLHEALAALRSLSPTYLRHFMAQVDALLWLDQAAGAAPALPPSASAAPATPEAASRRAAATRPARAGRPARSGAAQVHKPTRRAG